MGRDPAILAAAGGSDVAEDFSFRPDELPEDSSLILVDDDRAFVLRLARAMEGRGFEVRTAHSVAEGMELIRQKAPSSSRMSTTAKAGAFCRIRSMPA